MREECPFLTNSLPWGLEGDPDPKGSLQKVQNQNSYGLYPLMDQTL